MGKNSWPEIFGLDLQQEGTLNYFEFVSELIGRQQHDARGILGTLKSEVGDDIWTAVGPKGKA